MEFLRDLFVRQSELMRETFYNQYAWDENQKMIEAQIQRLSIEEINKSWEMYRKIERARRT